MMANFDFCLDSSEQGGGFKLTRSRSIPSPVEHIPVSLFLSQSHYHLLHAESPLLTSTHYSWVMNDDDGDDDDDVVVDVCWRAMAQRGSGIDQTFVSHIVA